MRLRQSTHFLAALCLIISPVTQNLTLSPQTALSPTHLIIPQWKSAHGVSQSGAEALSIRLALELDMANAIGRSC